MKNSTESAQTILEEISIPDLANRIQAIESSEFDSHVIVEIIKKYFSDQYDRLRMRFAYMQDYRIITQTVTLQIGQYVKKYKNELGITHESLRGEPTLNANGNKSSASVWRKITK
ncbi:MAG: hypothetical protein K2K43_01145 [Alistipes sp.]|nr:hypothetical protein [Alistipes sp.]